MVPSRREAIVLLPRAAALRDGGESTGRRARSRALPRSARRACLRRRTLPRRDDALLRVVSRGRPADASSGTWRDVSSSSTTRRARATRSRAYLAHKTLTPDDRAEGERLLDDIERRSSAFVVAIDARRRDRARRRTVVRRHAARIDAHARRTRRRRRARRRTHGDDPRRRARRTRCRPQRRSRSPRARAAHHARAKHRRFFGRARRRSRCSRSLGGGAVVGVSPSPELAVSASRRSFSRRHARGRRPFRSGVRLVVDELRRVERGDRLRTAERLLAVRRCSRRPTVFASCRASRRVSLGVRVGVGAAIYVSGAPIGGDLFEPSCLFGGSIAPDGYAALDVSVALERALPRRLYPRHVRHPPGVRRARAATHRSTPTGLGSASAPASRSRWTCESGARRSPSRSRSPRRRARGRSRVTTPCAASRSVRSRTRTTRASATARPRTSARSTSAPRWGATWVAITPFGRVARSLGHRRRPHVRGAVRREPARRRARDPHGARARPARHARAAPLGRVGRVAREDRSGDRRRLGALGAELRRLRRARGPRSPRTSTPRSSARASSSAVWVTTGRAPSFFGAPRPDPRASTTASSRTRRTGTTSTTRSSSARSTSSASTRSTRSPTATARPRASSSRAASASARRCTRSPRRGTSPCSSPRSATRRAPTRRFARGSGPTR